MALLAKVKPIREGGINNDLGVWEGGRESGTGKKGGVFETSFYFSSFCSCLIIVKVISPSEVSFSSNTNWAVASPCPAPVQLRRAGMEELWWAPGIQTGSPHHTKGLGFLFLFGFFNFFTSFQSLVMSVEVPAQFCDLLCCFPFHWMISCCQILEPKRSASRNRIGCETLWILMALHEE